MKAAAATRSIVICLGSTIVTDDAAGYEVYNLLRREPLPGGVEIVFLGLGGIALLDHLKGEDTLIIVDAFRLGSIPGTVHQMELSGMPAARGPSISNHHLGLREILEAGKLLYPGRIPGEVIIIGIEGRCFDQLGEELTPEVREGTRQAAALIRKLVNPDASCSSEKEVKYGHAD